MKHLKTFEKIYYGNEIFNAIRNRDLDKVKELIKSGVNLEILNNVGYTPLISSIINNSNEITNELIKSGANVNFKNKNEDTALIISAYYNNQSILNLLIKADAYWNSKDNFNKDFLDYLSNDQKQEIIKLYPEKYEEYLAKKESEKYNI